MGRGGKALEPVCLCSKLSGPFLPNMNVIFPERRGARCLSLGTLFWCCAILGPSKGFISGAIGSHPKRTTMRCTSGVLGLDELLQKVREEEDRDKRVLMTQMIALALEKEVIQMEKEVIQKETEVIQMERKVIQMEREKQVIQWEKEKEVLKKNELNNELLSLKGELTARYLLERCVHKIKTEIGEELSRQSTKQVLGSVNNLQESACAQKLVAAVKDCNGQKEFAGSCYQNMYAQNPLPTMEGT